MTVRVAPVSAAHEVAELLDAFNTEFDTPTPGWPRSPHGWHGYWPTAKSSRC